MVYLFSLNEKIAPTTLDSGFRILFYRSGLEYEWLELLNTSGEFRHLDLDLLERDILSCLVPGSAVFVTFEDKIIGCSAAVHLKDYEPYAVLAYPVVLSEYRKHGLGSALIVETMNACHRAGYPGVILHTQAPRMAAIKTYLGLGFKPDVEKDWDAREQWRQVYESIEKQQSSSIFVK